MARLSTPSLGMTLLAVWLILTGILPFLAVGFSGLGLILNLIAIVAGVLILMRK